MPVHRIAPVDFGRMAKNLSRIRLILGAVVAVAATGFYLFNYFTKPNLGVAAGLTTCAVLVPVAFLCGWVPGLALTWILKWLDRLFSP